MTQVPVRFRSKPQQQREETPEPLTTKNTRTKSVLIATDKKSAPASFLNEGIVTPGNGSHESALSSATAGNFTQLLVMDDASAMEEMETGGPRPLASKQELPSVFTGLQWRERDNCLGHDADVAYRCKPPVSYVCLMGSRTRLPKGHVRESTRAGQPAHL
ncbi:hypothetical protein HPB47_011133 [Ixodes persulcatus]|uniref:Uncharacterized protein n=1 Tax=Ixodes persulcatus TaxID=34615 RepID=A0AC60NXG6_IXOPE|nr:hypothetical protein HPB47_011133 [Ixodes persulcatus]